jgi:hypothetical protein
LAGSEWQHLQVGGEPEPAEGEACEAGIAPGAAAATPNINASSIATHLWTKAFIRMADSACTGLSLGRTIVRLASAVILFLKRRKPRQAAAEKQSSQFFRVPQSSMDAKQTPRRSFDSNLPPGAVLLLFPGVKGLAINLMHAGLRHRHSARCALHEEVHIVNRTISPYQIHTCETDAATESGKIFQMDPDKLKAQFLVVVLEFEIAAVRVRVLGDVFFDAGCDVIDGHFGSVGRLGRAECD